MSTFYFTLDYSRELYISKLNFQLPKTIFHYFIFCHTDDFSNTSINLTPQNKDVEESLMGIFFRIDTKNSW
jgi:hypothetical protein